MDEQKKTPEDTSVPSELSEQDLESVTGGAIGPIDFKGGIVSPTDLKGGVIGPIELAGGVIGPLDLKGGTKGLS